MTVRTRFEMRASAATLAMIEELANRAGQTSSSLMKRLVRREHERIFGKQPLPVQRGSREEAVACRPARPSAAPTTIEDTTPREREEDDPILREMGITREALDRLVHGK